MMYFLVPRQNADFIQDYSTKLGEWGKENMVGLTYEDAVNQTEFPPGRYIYTGLDRLGPHTSRVFGELHEKLRANLDAPPLNHPVESLRRLELLKALHEAGLNRFRAFGAWEDLSDLNYPVFVRHRSQDGGVPKLQASRGAVDREVGRLMMNGAAIDDVLVVEFLDTADSEGIYRKYSVYYLEGHTFPTALDMGKEWVMRNHSTEFTDAFFDEEEEYLTGNPHEKELVEIFQLAKIEFGRADYSLLDGRVQTWEINTLPLQRRPPGVKPRPEFVQTRLKYKKELSTERFSAAYRDMNSKDTGGSPVQVAFTPEVMESAKRELASSVPPTYPQGDRFELARTLLRPFKPVLKPLAERFLFPLLSRRGRADERKGS